MNSRRARVERASAHPFVDHERIRSADARGPSRGREESAKHSRFDENRDESETRKKVDSIARPEERHEDKRPAAGWFSRGVRKKYMCVGRKGEGIERLRVGERGARYPGIPPTKGPPRSRLDRADSAPCLPVSTDGYTGRRALGCRRRGWLHAPASTSCPALPTSACHRRGQPVVSRDDWSSLFAVS